MSSTIRPRRTGALVFGARVLSVFTGALFLVMITRSLSTSQFGLWEVIADIAVFSSYPAGLLTYWATREVARGRMVGKTTLTLNLLASVLGIGIFIAFALASYSTIGASFAPFILAIILVPLTYWNQATTALVSGYDPGIGAYSLVSSEVAKLLAAYPLLFIYRLNVMGVILAISVSYFVLSGVSTILLRPVTKDKVDVSLGRKWLKDSAVPALNMLVYAVAVADTFVAALGQHFTTLAGYYQAAAQVAIIVGYASYLSVALYPVLLRDRSERLPSVMIDFTLLFAIPMAAGAIALSSKILFLLSPKYVASSLALVILCPYAVVAAVSTILDQALMGRETIDLQARVSRSALMKSDLVFVPVANLVYFALYLTAVYLIATQAVGSAAVYNYVPYWAAAQLACMIGLVVVKARRLAGKVRLVLPPSLALYLLTGAAMGAIVYLVGYVALPSGIGSLDYGIRLLVIVAAGTVFYFGVLSMLDKKVRRLVRSVIGMLMRTEAASTPVAGSGSITP